MGATGQGDRKIELNILRNIIFIISLIIDLIFLGAELRFIRICLKTILFQDTNSEV